MSRKEVILTAEGLKALQEEVNLLSTVKRDEVADRIRAARDFGDITENSEYDDAKNEQAMLEHRISLVQEKLRRARVIKDSEIETEKVSIGSTVTLRDKDARVQRTYTVVGSAEADPVKARLSNESPVGQAIIGKRVGDVVTVPVPLGSMRYEIVKIDKMKIDKAKIDKAKVENAKVGKAKVEKAKVGTVKVGKVKIDKKS